MEGLCHFFLHACLLALLLIGGFLIVGYLHKKLNRESFENKIVLVTGGAMGIGKLICEKLKAEGAIVVIWDVNESALNVMKHQGFHTYLVDVTNRDEVFDVQKHVQKDVGVVDILINNAGIVNGKPLMELTEKQVKRLMNVNVISHFWTCQAFLPDMLERNSGHIVTISSIAGIDGLPFLTDYCTSKFACRGFAESLRRELSGTRIKTTIVHPFVVNTGLFHGSKSSTGIWKLFGSMIEPDYTAREILKAISDGQIRLILPRRSYIVPLLAEILPWRIRDIIAKKQFGLEEGGISDPRKKSD